MGEEVCEGSQRSVRECEGLGAEKGLCLGQRSCLCDGVWLGLVICRAGFRLAHQEEVDGKRRSDEVRKDPLEVFNIQITEDGGFSGCLW